MSKIKKWGAFSLALLLVLGITGSTRAGNKDGEFCGEFWDNIVEEFIENLTEADQTSTFRVRIQYLRHTYTYYTSTDFGPLDKTDVYFTLEMGKQKRRMPDDEGRYWSIVRSKKTYTKDWNGKSPEATFSVPASQSSYRVLIKAWNYDDDLIGWVIVEYYRDSSSASIVKNSSGSRIAIKLDFVLE